MLVAVKIVALAALQVSPVPSSALLLIVGYKAIRGRRIALHKACMLTALAVSVAFLASYLYYHFAVKHGQPTHFADCAPDAPT